MESVCPICNRRTFPELDSFYQFGVTKCGTCPYELQQKGNYRYDATIEDEKFRLEDGWGDEKKFYVKIREMKVAIGKPDEPLSDKDLKKFRGY